jgi:hypothetical protein
MKYGVLSKFDPPESWPGQTLQEIDTVANLKATTSSLQVRRLDEVARRESTWPSIHRHCA